MYLICEPRTGSTLAAKQFSINPEIFLEQWEIINDEMVRNPDRARRPTYRSFYEKLQWLFLKRASGETFYFKIIPHNLTPLMKKELLYYLEGEDTATIERNPWDACMSFLFQNYTKWKVAHNTPKKTAVAENFTAVKHKIAWWVKEHYQHKQFLKSCNNVKVIKYEDVCKLSKNEKFLKPLNINYKECINNYDEAKLFFDKEMKNNAQCDFRKARH